MTKAIGRVFLGAALAFSVGGCSKRYDEVVANYRLASSAGCAGVEEYAEDVAVLEMKKWVDAYGEWYGEYGTDDLGAPSAESGGDETGSQASGTNNQEAGVDEPDFVKNDTDQILVLSGQYLVAIDAVPADQMHELSRTSIEGSPFAMVREGNRVAVLSWAQPPDSIARDGGGGSYDGPPVDVASDDCIDCGSYWTPTTKVTVLGLSDATAPVLERELYVEGSYVGARLIDGRLHLVTATYTPGPAMTLWAETELAREILKAHNEQLIRDQPLDAWIPRFADRVGSVETTGSLGTADDCGGFYQPLTPMGRTILSLATLPLTEPAGSFQSASIVSEPGVVYASEESLYVSIYLGWFWFFWTDGEMPEDRSVVHKFDLGGEIPAYAATGAVDGYAPSQFAMDEHDDVLRIATTTSGFEEGDWEPENHLTTLREAGGELEVAGSIHGIAPGERITSSRFDGEVGYLVTFRQVDPLYTLDLSDPESPAIVDELHVTGFSTYIHPYEGGKLLTIGYEATEEGQVTGSALSLFDVAELDDPSLLFREELGESWSEAQWDHKAFNFFPPAGVLALPLVDYEDGFAGLEVWDVSGESGFALRGRVDHQGFVPTEEEDPYYGWWTTIRRSVIIDGTIYSISDLGVKANDLGDLGVEYAALPLPANTPYGYYYW